MFRPLAIALLALLTIGAPGALAASPAAPCTGDPAQIQRIEITVGGQTAFGNYTLPKTAPKGLVVFGHGYTYNEDAFRNHMERASTRDGLVAVAMNYRGLTNFPRDATTFERSRGFPVKAGSEDLVAVAQHLHRVCGGFAKRLLLGVSMGGNASGLAAAIGGKTGDGLPIFDYWVGVEGVYNFTETYNEARAAGATEAQEDIEKEAGGTIEQKPDAYAERTVLNRTADIAKSGIRGIALIHGVNDGLVPYNQAVEFARAMRTTDVPTDFYTAVKKAPGDQQDDTRLAPDPERPGHASEHAKHIVIDTGMDLIGAFSRGDAPPPCNRDFQVDGTATPTTSPDASKPAAGCPAKPTFAGAGTGAGGGGTGTTPGADGCRDTVRPALAYRVRRSGSGLTVRGTAKDEDCTRAQAGIRRVRIAVARRSGSRCRFVMRASTGRLSRPRSCTRRRIFLRPTGAATFRLNVRSLPAGGYRVAVVATDLSGNRRTMTKRARLR